MKKRRALIIAAAMLALVCTPLAGVPVATAQEQSKPWTQTFSVIYWPTSMTGQITLTGSRGSLTTSGVALSVPYLIFDYRLVSPLSLGLHLYYAPLLGASGFASGVSGNAGVWGAELTYQHIIPIKPPVVLVLNPFAGYGEQFFNESTTGPFGNPINFNETTGGFYVGLNTTLPLSAHWFLTGGLTWYPSGFANISVNAPVEGVGSSGTAGTPQLWENVSITYSTADHWNFTLGYQWAQVWISAVPLPITTRGGLTLGGTVCPCNFQLSGVLFSVGKTF